MPEAFIWLKPFLCFAVSMPSAVLKKECHAEPLPAMRLSQCRSEHVEGPHLIPFSVYC